MSTIEPLQKHIQVPLAVIWSWDSPLTPKQAVAQLQQIAELGITRVMIEWAPGAVPFWSDPWHVCFEAVLSAAQALGLLVVLRDSNLHNGDTPKCQAERPGVARHLNYKLIVVGRGERLVTPLPAGELVGARAYNLKDGQICADGSICLDDLISENLLDWNCSFDLALVTVFCSALDEGCSCTQFIFDDFRLHCLEAKLADIQRRYQTWMGNTLNGIALTVATCQHSLMWTPQFPVQFEQRAGYNLIDHLALLVLDGTGCESLRRDYHDVAGDLIIENFLEPSRRWIRSCGIRLYGGLSWEENGDTLDSLSLNRMRLLRHMDSSLVEQMPEQRDLLSMAMARAVSDCGKHQMEPVLRGALSQPVPGSVNRIKEAVSSGADVIWLDSVESSDPDLGCGALQQIISLIPSHDQPNEQPNVVGIYHPNKTLAAYTAMGDTLKGMYENSNIVADGERARRMTLQLEQMCEIMDQNGVSTRMLDTSLLCALQVNPGGSLQARMGGTSYPCIILPGVLVMSLPELLLLEDFVKSGGRLIAWGALPTHSPDEDEKRRLAACCLRLFGHSVNPKELSEHHSGEGTASFIPFEPGMEKACIESIVLMVHQQLS